MSDTPEKLVGAYADYDIAHFKKHENTKRKLGKRISRLVGKLEAENPENSKELINNASELGADYAKREEGKIAR